MNTISQIPMDLVSADEAAAILRLSKWTIYQWIGRGYIPHYRLGRLIRVRKSDLAAKLEQERRSGGDTGGLCCGELTTG